jgi:signal peptidase II
VSQKYLILLSLSGFIVCLDQWSKHMALVLLQPENTHRLLGGILEFVLVRNTGFGFGLVSQAPAPLDKLFFVGVPVFALVLIVLIFIKLQDDQLMTSVALAVIFSGAVGNLIDRVQHGYVIDWLRFRLGEWGSPALNFSDLSIAFGLILVFVAVLRQTDRAASTSGGGE